VIAAALQHALKRHKMPTGNNFDEVVIVSGRSAALLAK
jgi:hypothetical protein